MSKLVPAGQAWLTSVDAAVAVLAQIERVEDAVDLLGAAETAKKYARNVLRSREAQNHAAHVALLCQRRAGELLERLNLNGGDRKSESHDDRVKLGDLGVDANQSSRWQRVAAIPEEAFEAAVDEITSRGDELTTAGLIREATGAHVGHNSGDNEWYTPEPYIAAARDVLGEIDLDPASTETANAVVGAHTFITEQQNGLSKKWRGTVWMNPPYARPLVDQFCAKLAEHYSAGDVTSAIVLVNNATETGWFHALAEVASAMCFPRQRVKFWAPGKVSAPLQGQALIYLGPKVDEFRDRFVDFGFTVTL